MKTEHKYRNLIVVIGVLIAAALILLNKSHILADVNGLNASVLTLFHNA